jgi:hypothetical protein
LTSPHFAHQQHVATAWQNNQSQNQKFAGGPKGIIQHRLREKKST